MPMTGLTIERTPPSVSITQLKVAELHLYWGFIRGHRRLAPRLPATGLEAILAKVKADWHPEDVYAALRGEHATCIIVSRETRLLGFVIYYTQPRPWSGKLDLFIWCAWGLPPCLTVPGDNLPEAVLLTHQFLRNVKTELKAENIVFITSISRRGFAKRFGFRPMFTTFWGE